MTEPKSAARQGSLDHRHRHRLLARRRAGRALGCAERQDASMSTTSASRPTSCIRWRRSRFDAQIPKKGDQRQMEAWQRIGTYAAGLALDSAGVKGNKEILGRMDMIVAAGGGERDLAVDVGDPERRRQGQFRARLSQRTADERSAADAVPGPALQPARRQHRHRPRRVPARRAPSWARKPPASTRRGSRWRASQSGQSDIALVGAAHNGERKDLLILYEFGDFNLKDKFAPVWAREDNSGFALGSAGAFLVMESREHAEARGAKPYAQTDQGGRRPRAAQAAGRGDADRWKRCGRSSASPATAAI